MFAQERKTKDDRFLRSSAAAYVFKYFANKRSLKKGAAGASARVTLQIETQKCFSFFKQLFLSAVHPEMRCRYVWRYTITHFYFSDYLILVQAVFLNMISLMLEAFFKFFSSNLKYFFKIKFFSLYSRIFLTF